MEFQFFPDISQMKTPINFRKAIPRFYKKSEVETQKDPYERFDTMVMRQTALHLADQIWGHYPMQGILDFAKTYLPETENPAILEIGCSTGRWIASLAQSYPKASCWGLDYSYQMLKRANEHWVLGHTTYLDFSKQGHAGILELQATPIDNLKFGLAKASELPFADHSQDLLLHSFLLDRLDDPKKALQEMYRVLAPGAKMIFVTPLNFQKSNLWELYHPPIKIYQLLVELGFDILEWEEEMEVLEPLDLRGNAVDWKCVGVVARKRV